MDTQKKNEQNENKNKSMKYKSDSYTQTLISSKHLIININENSGMSNEDYINFFYRKNPGYLKLGKIGKSVNRFEISKNPKKKRENTKKKKENNAFQLFKEEYKKTNPDLSEQDILKKTKELWKQMNASLRNIYLNSELVNKAKKEN
jgi:hypothetical protein